jgi:mannose-6-phosphate isomerase-like protein (cupin superfamily)
MPTTPASCPANSRAWEIVDFDAIAPVPCPCGVSRRALAESTLFPGTIHRVDISADAKLHYHNRLTETYCILECGPDARLQLDDQIVPLRAGMCVVIPSGVRHRAIGAMRVLNIVLPKFDPADEFED